MENKETLPQNVTPDELIEFFVGTGVDPKCPACGNDTAAIQAETDRGNVRLLSNEYVELQGRSFARITDKVFPSALTVCERCGFIRAFAIYKVNAWLNEKHPGRKVAS